MCGGMARSTTAVGTLATGLSTRANEKSKILGTRSGMTMSTTEAGARTAGLSVRANGKLNGPCAGRWHDQVDNGSKHVGNGPECEKPKSLKYWAFFNKKTLFRVCGLMTKTLTQLELSLYEGYGVRTACTVPR